MKAFSILFYLLFSLSCQTRPPLDNRDPYMTVLGYLDREEYSEAEKYLLGKPKEKDSYWAMPTVRESKVCSEAINSCEQDFKSIQSVRRCYRELESGCPTNGKHLSNKAKIQKNETIDKLEAASDLLSPSTIYEKQCESGYRWGFEVNTVPKSRIGAAFSLRVDRSKLTGEYADKSKCEEARILANEASKFVHSSECYKRYLGENRFSSLWKTKVMHLDRKESRGIIQDSFPLHFYESRDCEAALKLGLKYVSSNGFQEIPIGTYGSEQKNRFISKCEQIKQLVCTRFMSSVDGLPDEIL